MFEWLQTTGQRGGVITNRKTRRQSKYIQLNKKQAQLISVGTVSAGEQLWWTFSAHTLKSHTGTRREGLPGSKARVLDMPTPTPVNSTHPRVLIPKESLLPQIDHKLFIQLKITLNFCPPPTSTPKCGDYRQVLPCQVSLRNHNLCLVSLLRKFKVIDQNIKPWEEKSKSLLYAFVNY